MKRRSPRRHGTASRVSSKRSRPARAAQSVTGPTAQCARRLLVRRPRAAARRARPGRTGRPPTRARPRRRRVRIGIREDLDEHRRPGSARSPDGRDRPAGANGNSSSGSMSYRPTGTPRPKASRHDQRNVELPFPQIERREQQRRARGDDAAEVGKESDDVDARPDPELADARFERGAHRHFLVGVRAAQREPVGDDEVDVVDVARRRSKRTPPTPRRHRAAPTSSPHTEPRGDPPRHRGRATPRYGRRVVAVGLGQERPFDGRGRPR